MYGILLTPNDFKPTVVNWYAIPKGIPYVIVNDLKLGRLLKCSVSVTGFMFTETSSLVFSKDLLMIIMALIAHSI